MKNDSAEEYRAASHDWQRLAAEKQKKLEILEKLLADYKRIVSILISDYDHPWPNEDDATKFHRKSVLELLENLRNSGGKQTPITVPTGALPTGDKVQSDIPATEP